MRALAFGAALAVVASPAFAADLPSRAAPAAYEPPPPMPVFSWGGAYAGVQVGYAFGRDHAVLSAPVTTTRATTAAMAPATPTTTAAGTLGTGTTTGATTTTTPVGATSTIIQTAAQAFNANGVIGGGHVGYNFVTGASGGPAVGVFGLEGDVDGTSYRRSSSGVATSPGFVAYPFAPSISGIRNDIQGSIRGRVGIGVQRVLFYATGGAAFADFNTSIPGTPGGGFDHTRVGYTVGGGIEYAMTNHVALRVEYRYSDFGRFTDSLTAPFPDATLSHRETTSRVQGGISYLFATPVAAPVAARY